MLDKETEEKRWNAWRSVQDDTFSHKMARQSLLALRQDLERYKEKNENK